MGKQINFYMAEPDEISFVQYLCAERDVGILTYFLPSENLQPLPCLPERDVPAWFIVWLWDPNLSPVPQLEYIINKGCYSPNPVKSEIIEFSRSRCEDNVIYSGRLWAEMAFWQQDGSRLLKSEPFRKWFGRLSNWIKRHSTQDMRGDFVMPCAAQRAAGGIKLAR